MLFLIMLLRRIADKNCVIHGEGKNDTGGCSGSDNTSTIASYQK